MCNVSSGHFIEIEAGNEIGWIETDQIVMVITKRCKDQRPEHPIKNSASNKLSEALGTNFV